MDKKMTSGEIAKKAGISQKAVRLYDEKGLLKPSDYSEGNYRLYDKEALLVLEKIIALKQIGFSLEEIKENLVGGRNESILETLQSQIDMMEAKRYELEKAITRMKAVIARSNGEPDWDDVADILKGMQIDQNKDEGHFYALDHTKGQLDWFVKIYRSLNVKENERVLDLGCGYSKVWRNSWKDIPENVQIDAIDVRGSWADDFEKFVEANKQDLADNTNIDVIFEDLNEDASWKHIKAKEKYSMILAHYVIDVLNDAESFIGNASEMLAEDGVFSLNGFGNMHLSHLEYWSDVLNEIGLDDKFIIEQINQKQKETIACKEILAKYFDKVEEVILPCTFSFETVDDILKNLADCMPGHEEFVEANKKKLVPFLEQCLQAGDVEIPYDEGFWRLRK